MKTCYYVLIVALVSILFFSCAVNKSPNTSATEVKGRYINSTFLKQIPDSIPGNISVYCYELNFDGVDSVAVLYGFENSKFLYRKQANSYKIVNASQGADVDFVFNKDKSITLIDTALTRNHANSTFEKAGGETGKESVIEKYINDKMITGEYVLYENGIFSQQKVQFASNGQLKGLKYYTSFYICYSGDCVEETEPISNIIYLKGPGNLENIFSFKIDKTANIITLYNIGSPIKDIKGSRKILSKAYEFHKK